MTREHDGLALDVPPFRLEERVEVPEIVAGPRIGITRGTELSWRYMKPARRISAVPYDEFDLHAGRSRDAGDRHLREHPARAAVGEAVDHRHEPSRA